MKEYIQKILSKKALTQQDYYKLFQTFNIAPVEQQAAILALLQYQKYTPEQLIGARQHLFERTKKIACPYDIIDIVGTGGDNIGTFNISTAASLVLASCGVYVAKHGGRSVTSLSGSADVLEKLGIPTPVDQSDIIKQLEKNNFVYLSSALFNPLLRNFKNLRKNLGIPSIFNLLGPILNPLCPKRTVLGVCKKNLIKPMISVLKYLGYTHALVVHSHDGLDELSISAPTDVAELKNGRIVYYTVSPTDIGLKQAKLNTVIGGSPTENAKIITEIIMGELKGPKLDIVLFNAAAGLLVANKVPDLTSGLEMAKRAILTKKTAQLLININQKN